MSLFRLKNVTCAACGKTTVAEAVGSINADRRPDYRDAILDDAFQDMTCSECGAAYRLQPDFNYLDAGRGQWIAALPAVEVLRYPEAEAEVLALFATSFGDRAPEAAQAVGRGLDVRVTFGWPGVREKILLRAHGLDDVVVEMMKLDLIRRMPGAPIAPGIELRIVAVDGEHLEGIWLRTASEAALGRTPIPRQLYDAVAADAEGWAPVRARLTAGPFVDMQTGFLEADRTPEAAE